MAVTSQRSLKASYSPKRPPSLNARRRSVPARLTTALCKLPPDILYYIADFLQSSTLSLCCQHLWKLLHHCHVSYHVREPHVTDVVTSMQHHLHVAQSLVLCIEGNRLPAEIMASLGMWTSAVALHALSIHMRGCCLGAAFPVILPGLSDAFRLHTVHISIRDQQLGVSGAIKELCHLKSLQSLCCLTLDLEMNHLREGTIRPLAELKFCPELHTFRVMLKSNLLGKADISALSELHDAPALQHLTLDLASNRLIPGEVGPLTVMKQASKLRSLSAYFPFNNLCGGDLPAFLLPSLQQLHLDFRGNPMGLGSAHALQALREIPFLRILHLQLAACGFGPADAKALSVLSELTTLHTLTLDMERNIMGISVADTVAQLHLLPNLRELDVNLGHVGISYGGAATLAMLHAAPALETLRLQLFRNRLDASDITALSELRHASCLRSLFLDLQGTDLQPGHFLPLGLFKETPSLSSITLDLFSNSLGPLDKEVLLALQHKEPQAQVMIRTDDWEVETDGPVKRNYHRPDTELLTAQLCCMPLKQRKRRSKSAQETVRKVEKHNTLLRDTWTLSRSSPAPRSLRTNSMPNASRRHRLPTSYHLRPSSSKVSHQLCTSSTSLKQTPFGAKVAGVSPTKHLVREKASPPNQHKVAHMFCTHTGTVHASRARHPIEKWAPQRAARRLGQWLKQAKSSNAVHMSQPKAITR